MPQQLLKPEVLAKLKNMDLVARAAVDGFIIGLHRSPTFGFSQEFAEYRPYTEGDDPRFVDWNVYARTERTYIKRYLGETNTHLIVMFDNSASMNFGSGEITKLQYAKFLGATLAYLASHQHDAVGLIVFDEQVHEYRPPSSRRGDLSAILHSIDRIAAGARTDFDAPFENFTRRVTRRGMVVVISDFYCDPDVMIDNVRPLAYRGQDVILLQVLDPQELKPALRQPTVLEDMETGETMEVSPTYLRSDYPDRIAKHIDALKLSATGAGVEHACISTSEPLDAALRKYLLFRQRRK